jgi:flagellar biosynthesis protein FlhG
MTEQTFTRTEYVPLSTDESAVLIPRQEPFVITIASGKSGVGKSVLVSNIALALANNHGAPDRTIILWDANVHSPNQNILFGIDPLLRARDFYSGNVRIAGILTDALGYVHSSVQTRLQPMLRLLAAEARPASVPVAPEALCAVMAEIMTTANADIIILDTAAGTSDATLQSCAFADIVLIAVTDEPNSIIESYGLVKTLGQYIPYERMRLVVCDVIDEEDAHEVARKFNLASEKFLHAHIPFIGYVPHDNAVRMSIIDQRPLLLDGAETEVGRMIEMIADQLLFAMNARSA